MMPNIFRGAIELGAHSVVSSQAAPLENILSDIASSTGAAAYETCKTKRKGTSDLDRPAEPPVRQGFVYAPLDLTKPSIRLIRILPEKSSDGLIRCTIHHATMDDRYICLSYMWGDAASSRVILVNDKFMHVRRNLFDFLDTVQSTHDTLGNEAYWIDAVCLDQGNTAERNHQVQQMGKIYAHAKTTRIWLGFQEKSELMFDALTRFLVTRLRPIDGMEWIQLGDNDQSSQFLHELFHNQYWGRAWVVQEILLSHRVTILLGANEISFLRLVGLTGLELSVFWSQNFTQFVNGLSPDFYQYAKGSRLEGASLPHLLAHFASQQCNVTHDRIFSLLSLAGEGSDLAVDYNITLLDLMFLVLDRCRSSMCVCSAAIVARSLLRVPGEPPLDAMSRAEPKPGVPYPYVQFHTYPRSGKGRWNILCFGKHDDPRVRDFRRVYRWKGGCCDHGEVSNLVWEEPTSAKQQVNVYATMRLSASPLGHHNAAGTVLKICTLGNGLTVFESHAIGSRKGIHTVRIALTVLDQMNELGPLKTPYAEDRNEFLKEAWWWKRMRSYASKPHARKWRRRPHCPAVGYSEPS